MVIFVCPCDAWTVKSAFMVAPTWASPHVCNIAVLQRGVNWTQILLQS